MAKTAKPATKIKLKEGVTGVRAETGVRVHLKAGETYEILSITETRPGTFAVAVEDPDELHNDRPCTIWAQIPADIIA